MNAALCELLGYDAATLNTKTVQDITHPDDVEPGRRRRQALLDGTSRRHRHETRFVNAQGIVVGVLHSCSVVPSADGRPPHLVDHIEDITERKLFESHLRHEALHDTLTGLPNRALLMDRLEQALAASGRTHAPIAVLFLDVDRFKAVNDTYGHRAGDEVLLSIADRLRAALRPGDTACRLAGDQFVVLCENCTPDQAMATAARLVNVLSRPLAAADTTLVVSASIGIAVSRLGDSTPEGLLHDADAAMYIAKGHGRGLVEVFDERLGEQIALRVRREVALAHAIPSGQLRLHFQPEINLSDGTTVGVEALVRWQHPEEGLLPPAAFIALAEDTGLITDVGNWVLDAALAEAARRLRDLGGGEPVMWVNLSAHQIQHPGLADTVAGSLQRHGLPGAALGLEITESVLMRDFEVSRATLLQLKQMGVTCH